MILHSRSARIVILAGAALFFFSANLVAAATWEFLVYGDSRGNGTDTGTNNNNGVDTVILGELAAQTVHENPAFVLFPGDLVSTGGTSSFNTWKSTMQPVYNAGIGVCPVAGNHDASSVDSLSTFKSMFITPLQTSPFAGCQNVVIDSTSDDGRSYSFQYRNATFLGLDNYANGSKSYHKVDQAFVDARLAARDPATSPLVFAFDHEPAFKPGPDTGLEANPTQRDAFWNSLKSAGCRDFFAGHDHSYAHAVLQDSPGDGNPGNDITQFVVGTGGAPLYTTSYSGNTGAWTVDPVFNDDTHFGYLRVVVDDTAHTVTRTWVQRTGVNTFVDTSEVSSYTYTVAPEPASMALLVAGVLCLVLWRQRFR
jgi:hypothetical protein